ncbi:hypothetical protein EV128_12515 [Rhizobium azibense]|nr:hypothetical protein EV128_12515 [Rhizobium azibense]
MLQKVKGQIITAGYDWSIQISFEKSGLTFPSTATFVSQVRRDRNSEEVLTTLTTANGNIGRVSDKILNLKIPGSITADWPDREAHIDIVRTDGGLKQHLGILLVVPVRRPVTRI